MASAFYRSLKYLCASSLSFYFRKWQIEAVENIPDGPVIFVPNHQNAFLDAIIVTCSSKKNPWYLTRANVFSKSFAAWLLNKLQMLPIYRFRDGYATLKKNDQVMEDIVKKLEKGETILIFAEGNHGDTYQLRPLQKGVARILMAVDSKTKVAVVPVGIQYESRTAFRSRVLVNYGKPIYIDEFNFGELPVPEKMDAILLKIQMQLKTLMLNIESPGYDEKWEYLLSHRQYSKNLKDQLKSDQSIVASYPDSRLPSSSISATHPGKNIFMWYWKFNSLIAWFVIQKLIINKLEDPQFTGSIKYGAGTFLTPIIWFLQAFVIYLLTGSLPIATLYLISIPVSIKLS